MHYVNVNKDIVNTRQSKEARAPHLLGGLLEALRVEVALLEARDEAFLGGHQFRDERFDLRRWTQRVLNRTMSVLYVSNVNCDLLVYVLIV